MVVFLMTTTAALSLYYHLGGDVAQLVSARLSWQEFPASILGNFNVCFRFRLIRVAIASNTRKTEHWRREGVGGRTFGFH